MFKNIQIYLKKEARNLFWSGILDMFSLYNSFLSLKSKQFYLKSKYCCSSDFFSHHIVNELKGLYDEWFSICFCSCYFFCFFFDQPNMAQMFGSSIQFLELDHLYSQNCKLVLTLGFICRVIDWTKTNTSKDVQVEHIWRSSFIWYRQKIFASFQI